MVVPQGLSYAKLAGLPSVWGLYGAFVPCIIYGLFGSSKQLVTPHPWTTQTNESILLYCAAHGMNSELNAFTRGRSAFHCITPTFDARPALSMRVSPCVSDQLHRLIVSDGLPRLWGQWL